MTKHQQFFDDLCREFYGLDVKTKPGGKAGPLPYITARTVMNRLDEVAGPENWWDDYSYGENSVVCRLSIRLPDGQVVVKMDAGGFAGMSDQGDDDKSGFSDAFKRAAVKFGIGRELYGDGTVFGRGDTPPTPPALPAPAPPAALPPPSPPREPDYRPPVRSAPSPEASRREAPPQSSGGQRRDSTPKTGRSLFAEAKKRDVATGSNLVGFLNHHGKKMRWEGQIVAWPESVVKLAYEAMIKHLESPRD